MNAASSRLDQCDRPVWAGGLVRVNAKTRPRTAAGTCSRGAPRRRSSNPETPAAAKRDSHRSTVGRDTPASAATSTFGRPSARHNTIRARVATEAETSALFTSVANSARCSDVNSTGPANPKTDQASVKTTQSRDTRASRIRTAMMINSRVMASFLLMRNVQIWPDCPIFDFGVESGISREGI